jgi:hypothetical protein
MDQQSLDPEEGARGLNPLIVYKRVDFAKSQSFEEIITIHHQRTFTNREIPMRSGPSDRGEIRTVDLA